MKREDAVLRVEAVRATKENVAEYGKLTRLNEFEEFSTEEWCCWVTETPCMEQPAYIGMGLVQGSPCRTESMRRHQGTKKLFAPGTESLVLLLAKGGRSGVPVQDVRAFLLKAGEFLVIDEGVWYAAGSAAESPSRYYFASMENQEDHAEISLLNGCVEIVVSI